MSNIEANIIEYGKHEPTALQQQLIRKGGTVTSSALPEAVGTRRLASRYDAAILIEMLEISIYHARCCETKAMDTVGAYNFPGKDGAQPPALARFLADNDIVAELRQAMLDYEACGNGYVELTIVSGQPTKLLHRRAQEMSILRDPDGGTQHLFVQQVGTATRYYKPAGDERTISAISGRVSAEEVQASEIIHLRQRSPLDPYYGVPTWIALAPLLWGMRAADIYNYEYFQNNTIPDYAIIAEGGMFAETVQSKIKEFLEREKQKGKNSAGRVLTLGVPGSGGNTTTVKFQKLQADSRDGSYGGYLDRSTLTVVRGHGVPPTRIGIMTAGQLGGAGAGENETQNYRDMTIEPRQEMLERLINKYVIERLAPGWRIKFAEVAVPDDRAGRADTAIKMFQAGLWPANRAIEYVDGAPPSNLDGGDEHVIQSGGTPMLLADVVRLAAEGGAGANL